MLVLPLANAEMMGLHLGEIIANITPDAHAVFAIDGSGWHRTSDKLRRPNNITPQSGSIS